MVATVPSLELAGARVSKDGPYAALTAAVEQMAVEDGGTAPPPEDVRRAVARVVGAASPPFRTLVGTEARAIVALHSVMPDRLFATGVRRLIGAPRQRS